MPKDLKEAKRNRSEFGTILLLLAAGGAGIWFLRHHAATQLPEPGNEVAQENSDVGAPTGATGLRAVDFRNFTYRPACLGEGTTRPAVRTRNGRYESSTGDETVSLEVAEVAFGDLTDDGQDEAAVLTVCNTGGSGVFTEGVVYQLQNGEPVELARTQEGDRAFGGLAGLTIINGTLVVQRFAGDENGPACCPKYIDTTRWRWTGTALEQTGSTTRRNTPAQQGEKS